MGQLLQKKDCPTCGKPMVMALPPGGKGPRVLQCIECDALQDEKMRAWIKGGLQPPQR
jgi:hypothetical protein